MQQLIAHIDIMLVLRLVLGYFESLRHLPFTRSVDDVHVIPVLSKFFDVDQFCISFPLGTLRNVFALVLSFLSNDCSEVAVGVIVYLKRCFPFAKFFLLWTLSFDHVVPFASGCGSAAHLVGCSVNIFY